MHGPLLLTLTLIFSLPAHAGWFTDLAKDCAASLSNVKSRGLDAGPEIEVEIVEQLQKGGWDNRGVFEVRAKAFPGRRLVAKVTSYQSDFLRIADNNRRLAQTTPLAAEYFGQTRISIRGTPQRAYLTEFVDGVVSKDPSVRFSLNTQTMNQVEQAFRALLAADILPFDFQFMVTSEGAIKIIDADLYVTIAGLRENGKLREGRTTTREEAKRLLHKIEDPADGDMIWGRDFFMMTGGDTPARSIALLELLKAKAASMGLAN